MGGDYEVLVLEGGCKGRDSIVGFSVLDIVEVGWGLIGAGEESNGVVGWRGVVSFAGLEGGPSVGESAEDSR